MRKKLFGLLSSKTIKNQPVQSGFLTPYTQQKHFQAHNDSTQVNRINQKLIDFFKYRQAKKLVNKIKDERGRNHSIKYQEEFKFKEQWQLIDKSIYTLNYNYLFPEKVAFRILNGIMLFLFIFQIWLLSVFRLFQYQDSQWVFFFSLIVNLLDVILKAFFILWFISDENIKNEHKKMDMIQYIKQFIGNLFACLYSILGILNLTSDIDNDLYLVMDFACIISIHIRCKEIYTNFKILIICSKYKPYIKIYDLMSNLFLLTHIFGSIIYGVSRFQPNQSYLSTIQVKGPMSWIQKYIYSIYFSSTTMLTVGYGDMLPSNIQEIVVVLVMQLFGIVMIGYINGQVGDILCTLRKQRENLEDDLTNSQKLSKSFRLDHQTSQKIRQYLINNRKLDQEINVQDQNNILSKISDQLRNQANLTNHINIIKESLFFIYNFSKKTQIQVSYKLKKIITSPHQTLPQIMGKQKIYLISKGQIALYLTRKNKKGNTGKKIIKILSKKNNQDFHQNSFGHSALVLGRPTQLKAFSKNFAVCHTIERYDLLDALGIDSNDLERFHEIRAKCETCKNPQSYECPQFYSIRENYNPNPQFIIKRYLNQKYSTKRKEWIRNRQKTRRIIEKLQIGEYQEFFYDLSVISGTSSSQLSSIIDPDKIKEELILTTKQRQNKYKNIDFIEMQTAKIKTRSYNQKYMNKKYQEKKRQELVRKFKPIRFQETFQTLKDYSFFFKHANITQILNKYTQSNSILKFVAPVLQVLPNFDHERRSLNNKIQPQLVRKLRRLKTHKF